MRHQSLVHFGKFLVHQNAEHVDRETWAGTENLAQDGGTRVRRGQRIPPRQGIAGGAVELHRFGGLGLRKLLVTFRHFTQHRDQKHPVEWPKAVVDQLGLHAHRQAVEVGHQHVCQQLSRIGIDPARVFHDRPDTRRQRISLLQRESGGEFLPEAVGELVPILKVLPGGVGDGEKC